MTSNDNPTTITDDDTKVVKNKEHMEEEIVTSDEEVVTDEEEEDYEDYDEEEDEDEEELTSEEILSLLNLAVENDRVDIVKEMLQQYPSYLNNGNATESTPLHISIQNKSIQCLNCLLRMGANPSIINSNGQTAYEIASKNNANANVNANVAIQQINQAFFMEMVRVMNIGDIKRIEEILKSGYVPDQTIIDWIPDGDGSLDDTLEKNINDLFINFHIIKPPQSKNNHDNENDNNQEEEVVKEQQSVQTPTAINNNISMPQISKLKQEVEEKTQLQKQLAKNLEDMVQIVTISQSLILNGSSALVAHVKKLKANKIQKEIELEQYNSIFVDLKLQLGQNNTNNQNNIDNDIIIENQTNYKNENEEESIILILTKEVNDVQTSINKIKSNILDLSEENIRITTQINNLGLSGALTFTKKLYDDVRTLDLLISNAQSDIKNFKDKLGLNVVLDKNNDGSNTNDDGDGGYNNRDINNTLHDQNDNHDDDDNDEYEEYSDDDDDQSDDDTDSLSASNNNSSNTANIITGKSKALIVRNTNSSLDLWDIIRRLIGRVVIVSASSSNSSRNAARTITHNRKKSDNRFVASGNVMII